MSFLKMILPSVRALILSRAQLSIELLALRQQLVVLRRTVPRPKVHRKDRLFWRRAVASLERLAASLDHRQTPDGNQMASSKFQDVLALEIQSQTGRPSQGGQRNPGPDWQNVSRESSVGCTPHPVGATPSGIQGWRFDSRQIQNPRQETAFANLEDIS